MVKIDNTKIKEGLFKAKYLTREEILKAEKSAQAEKLSLLDYLLNKGVVSRQLLGQSVAETLGVPFADLGSNQTSKNQVLKIDEATAKKYRVALFKEDDKSVVLATDDPTIEGSTQALKKIFPEKKIIFAFAFKDDIEEAFLNYRQNLETRFIKIIHAKKKVAPGIIEEILEDALAFRASDIHFDPTEKDVNVRFRVDGVLREVGRIPKDYYGNILNRVKVQAHLRIDEHFSAQDGAIRYLRKGKAVDLRISVVPTLDGEKIAIRVLAEYVRGFTLGDLGLAQVDQKLISESIKRPFGMILVTGPTGSGKTTTLYSLIKILNRPEVNIMTIEDPVEYKILGINQIQVNRQTDLTFSKGLPSILRQDPDIVLVGEIRGPDTATVAVNAALTGHLLLSTFHANDAATAIPRLIDMGIEPFLVASTLELIVAQRLVRKICENCRESVNLKLEDLKKLSPILTNYFPNGSAVFYRGKGCEVCGGLGYRGRTAIFEFIRVDQAMQELILKNPSTRQVLELSRTQPGFHSLFEDGLEKVRSGVTAIEELLRVASIRT